MSPEPLDICREWHLSDDSDLDILSELIRLYSQFWCPNSSLSPQLCIDRCIFSRKVLYRSHRIVHGRPALSTLRFVTLPDNPRLKRDVTHQQKWKQDIAVVKTWFIVKNTQGLRLCQINNRYCTKASMLLKICNMWEDVYLPLFWNITIT